MSIDKRKLYSFFYSNGYKYLYHTNTIATSCSFIKQGGLLSKQEVENRRLKHISQDSNIINKSINTHNDISIDILNSGKFYAKLNYNGPVCFVISIDILLNDKLPDIYISTDNSIYIDNIDAVYSHNINEYINILQTGTQNRNTQIKMISFKNCNDIIPFNPYLKRIVVDYPKTYDMDSNILIEYGIKSLENCIKNNPITTRVEYYNYIIEPSNYNINLLFNPNLEN